MSNVALTVEEQLLEKFDTFQSTNGRKEHKSSASSNLFSPPLEHTQTDSRYLCWNRELKLIWCCCLCLELNSTIYYSTEEKNWSESIFSLKNSPVVSFSDSERSLPSAETELTLCVCHSKKKKLCQKSLQDHMFANSVKKRKGKKE